MANKVNGNTYNAYASHRTYEDGELAERASTGGSSANLTSIAKQQKQQGDETFRSGVGYGNVVKQQVQNAQDLLTKKSLKKTIPPK